MTSFSSKRTFKVHAQISCMRIETRRLGTSAAHKVVIEGRMIHSDLAKLPKYSVTHATFGLVEKKKCPSLTSQRMIIASGEQKIR